ncbi:MAG: 3-phosphoshikimate 1-carboxyvinyltransferase [Akkermansiaceae bacterium]|nr:3-phosphoshikimate 1-carboxyvinyltransferase [Akkermansiaceae bacterium]
MTNNTLSSHRADALRGVSSIPGDKSISHRVAILGGLSRGCMEVSNFLCSHDCLNTLRAMEQLGARITPRRSRPGFGPVDFTLEGCAMAPKQPQTDIDCGNSGTGMRLLAGLLSGLPFESRLFGDDSLSSRPMKRIVDPLLLMGAQIKTLGEKPGCAPLAIHGSRLRPIEYHLPMASAQVKSAILLAGMLTEGCTTIHQPALTRDHTERLFHHFGVPCTVDALDVTVSGPAAPIARDIAIPGDISSAAFWLVAASICPNAEITLRRVGLNPTRTAVLNVLRRMGADFDIAPAPDSETGEPYGDITIRTASSLRGTEILRHEIPNLIDEIPVLAVAAAFASGTTHIRHAGELRVKESDRIAATVSNLRAMGAHVDEYDDGFSVAGGNPLTGCTLPSYGDHRIAMSFLIAGLAVPGVTTLDSVENIDTSYPGFAHDLRSFAFYG